MGHSQDSVFLAEIIGFALPCGTANTWEFILSLYTFLPSAPLPSTSPAHLCLGTFSGCCSSAYRLETPGN